MNGNWMFLLLSALCGAALTACQTTGTVSAFDGEELYATYCASCHGANGAGDGPVAEALSPQPSDLRAIQARNGGTFPREEVIQLIDGRAYRAVHGTANMPVWGFAFGPYEADATASESNIRSRIEAIADHIAALQVAE